MIRVGPIGTIGFTYLGSYLWDYKGRTVSHIFLSWSDTNIESIQFGFIEKGILVLSELHGSNERRIFRAISVRRDASEYLTGLTGIYESMIGITSLTFHTNKRSYGPFGPTSGPSTGKKEFYDLRIDDGCEFGGFFGSGLSSLTSIGFYFTPKLPEMEDA